MSEPAIPTEMIVAATKAVQIIRVHTPEKNSQEIVQTVLDKSCRISLGCVRVCQRGVVGCTIYH